MKLISKILLGLFVVSTYSFANEWVYGNVSKVEDYGSYGNYEVLITLQNQQWRGNEDGAMECTNRFSVQVGAQGVTEQFKDRAFAMMLAANMSGKKVGLFVNTGGPYCKVQMVRIGDDF